MENTKELIKKRKKMFVILTSICYLVAMILLIIACFTGSATLLCIGLPIYILGENFNKEWNYAAGFLEALEGEE